MLTAKEIISIALGIAALAGIAVKFNRADASQEERIKSLERAQTKQELINKELANTKERLLKLEIMFEHMIKSDDELKQLIRDLISQNVKAKL